MKTNYKELIESLRRYGEMYRPSNQSDLYFQAADAIERLLNKGENEMAKINYENLTIELRKRADLYNQHSELGKKEIANELFPTTAALLIFAAETIEDHVLDKQLGK